MNLQQAIDLISTQTFLVEDLDTQIFSSEHITEVQEEAVRIFNGPKANGRTVEQIHHTSLIGKRAEFILLNLKDPNTGEKLFKNNPKPYHDIIFIPTGEEIEVKSRKSIIDAKNYINFELPLIHTHNDATTAIFFIGDKNQLTFYKTVPITKHIKENLTFIVKKNGSSYTISKNKLEQLLTLNANILFYDIGITKTIQWFNKNKQISQFPNGGYYIIERNI